MKILIPTDFSDPATNAANYAIKFCNHLNAEITLIHVLNNESEYVVRTTTREHKSETTLSNALEKEFAILTGNLQKMRNSNGIRNIILKGSSVAKTISRYAEKNKFDLIICGTRGASGFTKRIMGSNTAEIIAESIIPVLIVPDKAKFTGLKKIVYASDFRAVKSEAALLILFAKLFGAGIDILHVTENLSKPVDTDDLVARLSEKNNYDKIDVHIEESENIQRAIEKYISHARAGMLAMFTHRPTLYEKLFWKSITRELSFHARIPLLSLKR